ncbi:carbonic anhydrase 9 isoform 2-T2 [Liasis olivaceus]
MRAAKRLRLRFSSLPPAPPPPPLLLLLLLLLRASRRACAADDEESHAGLPGHKDRHWSYRDMPEWASMFPDCGGHMQSPINVDTAAASFSSKLEPLLLSGYDVPPNETLPLKNNGHTLLLGLPNKMTLSGGGFPQPYQAVQLHLHWGTGHTRPGSEHTVDGHRYAGEVGLEINEPYQHILKHLNDIKEEGEETVVAGFDVTKLLPDNFDRYFRYNGSLTTPPCYQTVNWTVFNQTVLLSQDQISVLEDTLQGEDDEPIQSNFRLPQSLYGRSVLSSFHILERVQPPGEGPSEGGDQPEPGAGGGLTSSLPDGTPREGPVTASGKDAEKQVGSSLHTGDILAALFGVLFAVTALAFLFYVHKHRSQMPRLRARAAKPTATYAPATTDENAL